MRMSIVRSNSVALSIVAVAAVIVGIYWFRDILTPFALAVFLWLVIDGFANGIRAWMPKAPQWAALTIALLVVLLGIGFSIVFIAENASSFASNAGRYQVRINEVLAQGFALTGQQGAAPTVGELFTHLNPTQFLTEIANTAQSIVGDALFVLIYIACLFAAQASFPAKLDAIFESSESRQTAEKMGNAIRKSIEEYLWIQTVTGAMIAFGAWVVFVAVGLDNALFWALITFLLSYIPAIGGALSTALPTLFALVQFPSVVPALIILGATQGIAFIVGNVIQPRMTGDSLNLSILVVFLSLALWSTLWGITGAFLSTPIAVMAMIVLCQFPSTRWIAVMLSANGRPDGGPPPASPPPMPIQDDAVPVSETTRTEG